MRTCRGCAQYPNCRREVAYPDQNYCADCLTEVLRASRAFVPEWRKRLIAKDMSRNAA